MNYHCIVTCPRGEIIVDEPATVEELNNLAGHHGLKAQFEAVFASKPTLGVVSGRCGTVMIWYWLQPPLGD